MSRRFNLGGLGGLARMLISEPQENEGVKAVMYMEHILGRKNVTVEHARLEWIMMGRDERCNVIVAYRIMTRCSDK